MIMSNRTTFPISLSPPPKDFFMNLGPDQNPRSYALVRGWMKNNCWQYVDLCNEVNCTRLAEDAAEEYNLYVDEVDFEIPEWVFDLASDTGTKYEGNNDD